MGSMLDAAIFGAPCPLALALTYSGLHRAGTAEEAAAFLQRKRAKSRIIRCVSESLAGRVYYFDTETGDKVWASDVATWRAGDE
jgi:hypothetical protein